MIRSIY